MPNNIKEKIVKRISKGISISTDYFPELKEGILALEKEIEDF